MEDVDCHKHRFPMFPRFSHSGEMNDSRHDWSLILERSLVEHKVPVFRDRFYPFGCDRVYQGLVSK